MVYKNHFWCFSRILFSASSSVQVFLWRWEGYARKITLWMKMYFKGLWNMIKQNPGIPVLAIGFHVYTLQQRSFKRALKSLFRHKVEFFVVLHLVPRNPRAHPWKNIFWGETQRDYIVCLIVFAIIVIIFYCPAYMIIKLYPLANDKKVVVWSLSFFMTRAQNN